MWNWLFRTNKSTFPFLLPLRTNIWMLTSKWTFKGPFSPKQQEYGGYRSWQETNLYFLGFNNQIIVFSQFFFTKAFGVPVLKASKTKLESRTSFINHSSRPKGTQNPLKFEPFSSEFSSFSLEMWRDRSFPKSNLKACNARTTL